MSLNKRRILYSLFILIFLIVTPLISLYATGYKISSDFRVQKTGIFIVDSEPPGANIYFNDKIEQNIIKKFLNQKDSFVTTPAKIKNILPGKYDIKIELDGYWPWGKKLEIKSGQSTFAEDIFLFKNELPSKLVDASGDLLLLTSNKNSLILNQNNNLILYRESNQNIQSISLSSIFSSWPAITFTPLWSLNADKLLIGSLIFELDDWHSFRDLREELGSNLENIKWSSKNNEELFYIRNNVLYRYDLDKKLVTPVVSSAEINDYHIDNNYIYLVKKANKTSELVVQREEEIFITINLPLSNYMFINPQHNLINLYDKDNNILYLVHPFNTIRPIRDSITNVNKTYWINNKKLLFANDFEIWLLDLDSLNRTLLTRISKPIKNILWHPNNNYIIYNTKNSLVTIELDRREKYNITKLIELDEIKKPHLDKDGSAIFFYARIGRQDGIYRLNIQ